MKKLMLVAGCGLLAAGASAAPKVSEATLLRMGPMPAEPVADGVITRAEREGASAQYGLISAEKKIMATRYNIAYLGWTEKGVYCAVRSSIPSAPQQLNEQDTVTLTLLPAKGTVKTFTKCVAKEGRKLKGIVDWGAECAETEIFVPWDEIGAKPADGETWGVQIALTYSSQPETAYWHLPAEEGEMGSLVFDRSMPIVGMMQFNSLESWRPSSNYRFKYRVVNTSDKPVRLDSKSSLFRSVGFSKLDSDAVVTEAGEKQYGTSLSEMNGKTLAAGAADEYQHIEWSIWGGSVSMLNSHVFANGKTAYRRELRWDGNNGFGWKDEKDLPRMDGGYWPTARRVRAWQLQGSKTATVRRKIEVIGPDGKVWATTDKTQLDTVLPELPEGDYRIVLTAWDKDGNAYTHEKTFSERKFEWEGNKLGCERIVLPPYTPIKVERGENGERGETANCQLPTAISFLNTGYRCKGALFDQMYGDGEALLAGPVAFKLNGKDFTVKGVRFLERADDRVVREVEAEVEGIPATITQIFDYDGFCEVEVRFRPTAPVTVDALDLYIPLKGELATLYGNGIRPADIRHKAARDSWLKKGEGEIWNAAQDLKPNWRESNEKENFAVQGYVYFGGVAKGVVRHYDTSENWSLEKGTIASDIVRKGNVATLHDRFINKKTTWPAGEVLYRFQLMPTPARPHEYAFSRVAENMYTYHCPTNAFNYHWGTTSQLWPINVGMWCYPNGDTSLLTGMFKNTFKWEDADFQKACDEYVAKNAEWFKNFPMMTAQDYRNGFRNAEWRRLKVHAYGYYIDPMMLSCYWPEWEKYKAEWFVLDRPWENVANEYLCLVSDSRIDKTLWDGKKALDEGYAGIYYDCFSSCRHSNFIAIPGSAYHKDGRTVASLDVFLQWRKLMKRTSTMCYVNGKNLFRRPFSEIHMTSHNIAFVSSFSAMNLSCERGSDGGEFPIRFPEGYTLTEILGRNSGAAPHSIVSTVRGETPRREKELYSLMGWMCAYGHFTIEDQGLVNAKWFEKAWNIPFDYGWGNPEKTVPHWYYDEKPQPFVHTGKDVRLTVAEKKDGSGALLMFGNLGDACTFSFKPADGRGWKYVDAEDGTAVDPSSVSIKRFGYRMVRVEK